MVHPYFFDGLVLAAFFDGLFLAAFFDGLVLAAFFVSIITNFVSPASFLGLLCQEASFLVFAFLSSGSFDLVFSLLIDALVSTSLSPTLDRSTFSNFSTFLFGLTLVSFTRFGLASS